MVTARPRVEPAARSGSMPTSSGLLALVVIAIGLIVAAVGLAARPTTTTVVASAHGYDAAANARSVALALDDGNATLRRPQGISTSDDRMPSEARGTSTTPTSRSVATNTVEMPSTIYRGGGSSPSNLKMRPGEDALSFGDSLSNLLHPGSPVLHPGRDYIGIDTSRLPPGSVVPDGVPGSALTPPGHVSVYVTDPDVLKAAIIEKGKFPK